MKPLKLLALIVTIIFICSVFTVPLLAQESETANATDLDGTGDAPWTRVVLFISLTAMCLVGLIVVLAFVERTAMKRRIRRLEQKSRDGNTSKKSK